MCSCLAVSHAQGITSPGSNDMVCYLAAYANAGRTSRMVHWSISASSMELMLLLVAGMRQRLSHDEFSQMISWTRAWKLRNSLTARITPRTVPGQTDFAFVVHIICQQGTAQLPSYRFAMHVALCWGADVVVHTCRRSCEDHSCTIVDRDYTERAFRSRCSAVDDGTSSCCGSRSMNCPKTYECIVTCRRSR